MFGVPRREQINHAKITAFTVFFDYGSKVNQQYIAIQAIFYQKDLFTFALMHNYILI